jgi:acetyltransferase-like isoleucine patch superfamily enzyme
MIRKILRRLLRPVVRDIINHDIRIWGDRKRVQIAKTAFMTNTLFNVSSGTITIGDYTFTGHNVCLITGTHDMCKRLEGRMHGVPSSGRDIKIGRGVWIGTNAVVLGPCVIGDHAVIAAGALVRGDVPENAVVAGVPARVIKYVA